MRVRFRKGKQRAFLDRVVFRLGCVSVRGILQFGFEMDYATLKSYYSERRLVSQEFFESLCYLAKIDASKLDVEYIDEHWGQVKGGKIER